MRRRTTVYINDIVSNHNIHIVLLTFWFCSHRMCVCVVLESRAGHASWSEESRYAVLRCLHVSVGHLPLLTCSTQLMKTRDKCINPPQRQLCWIIKWAKTREIYYFCLNCCLMLKIYEWMELKNRMKAYIKAIFRVNILGSSQYIMCRDINIYISRFE